MSTRSSSVLRSKYIELTSKNRFKSHGKSNSPSKWRYTACDTKFTSRTEFTWLTMKINYHNFWTKIYRQNLSHLYQNGLPKIRNVTNHGELEPFTIKMILRTHNDFEIKIYKQNQTHPIAIEILMRLLNIRFVALDSFQGQSLKFQVLRTVGILILVCLTVTWLVFWCTVVSPSYWPE